MKQLRKKRFLNQLSSIFQSCNKHEFRAMRLQHQLMRPTLPNTDPRFLHGPTTISLRTMQLALGNNTAETYLKRSTQHQQYTHQASRTLSPLWADISTQNVINYLPTGCQFRQM